MSEEPICIGWPECEADLPGRKHSFVCPVGQEQAQIPICGNRECICCGSGRQEANLLRELGREMAAEIDRRGSTIDTLREDVGDFTATNNYLKSRHAELHDLQAAMRAIAIALKEPAGGEYHSARKLANEWGIYNDDLDGDRVLLRLAETALTRQRLKEDA